MRMYDDSAPAPHRRLRAGVDPARRHSRLTREEHHANRTETETLDERAERLAAETAEVQRQQQALAAEEARRLAEHQSDYDQAVITGI